RARFQTGDFPAPVKYGYISVGVVEHGPRALLGQAVFCLYPHQTRYVVPAHAVHPLPGEVHPGSAVLAANLAAVVHGLWDPVADSRRR
ncbi:MAG: dehydrogenase, partial [Rhodospirillaceae bacterium]|nr:dehydrogenase [Rhodospirillaceae bacterium]